MVDQGATLSQGSARWFRPPRPHGDVVENRSVSFLELFYDLVFVVLIAQIAHTLALQVTWSGVADFIVVFGLIWIAWINGSLYHELHGGNDGRSRTYIFLQMALLVPMAVFAGHATDDLSDGRGFAIAYGLLLLLIGWQWFDVRRFDTEEWRTVAGRYVFGMVLIAAIVLASAVIDDNETRKVMWAVAVALTLAGNLVMSLQQRDDVMAAAVSVSESLAERFGLFIIIVLGEVVVGVVEGLSEVDHDFRTIATGLVALSIGLGFWWNYFDFVGGRVPRLGLSQPVWLFGHFPLALGVAATGAGMVGLIEHAGDGRTPAPTAWLISGATAVVLVSIAIVSSAVAEHPGRRLVRYSLVVAAAAALLLGAARPTPWFLALVLSLLLSVVWFEAFVRHARLGLSIAEE